jgi:hypothetical protein
MFGESHLSCSAAALVTALGGRHVDVGTPTARCEREIESGSTPKTQPRSCDEGRSGYPVIVF